MDKSHRKQTKLKSKVINSVAVSTGAIIASIAAFAIRVAVVQIPFFPVNKLFSILFISFFAKSLTATAVKVLFLALLPYRKKSFARFFSMLMLSAIPFACFDFAWWLLHKDIFQAGTTFFMQGFSTLLTGYFCWSMRQYKFHVIPIFYAFILQGLFYFFISFSAPFKYISIAAILFAAVECRIWFVILNEDFDKRIEKILFNFSNSN